LILDGNRRFARSIGGDFRVGHELGVQKAYEVLRWCLDLRIPAVTVWVLSTDNLRRTPEEVGHLMATFVREARAMAGDPRIHANRVRVRVIGRHALLPPETLAALRELESATAGHDGLLLNIAIGYGGREEIVDAVRRLLDDGERRGLRAAEVAAALTTSQIGDYLYTAGVPDPDFIIRTSGELRLGGFLLWQSAYSEYYFCEALWPEFRRVDFLRAIRSYQGRHRRYGR
jgi:short-chain Z-isoprenyl diphosphate synthase